MISAQDISLAVERRQLLGSDLASRYDRMVEIRVLEERVLELFREGLVDGSTHTCQGQEAVAVGVATSIRVTDLVACTYRGHGHALALGMTPIAVLGEIVGRTVGCIGGLGGSMHLSDPEIGLLPTFAIVGAGMPVAAGVGLAAQVKGRDDIGVAVFGDGAANIGAFHESLNLAAIWRLPVVFVCENNQYGEYSRISKTTPIADIAVRASSYDIPSEIVDGQDVLAVESAMAQAVARAREGNGPTLLEMKTYRYAGHSRSDEALYRPAGELEEWKERDPIGILADHIMAHGGSGESLKQIESAAADRVRRALESVLAAPPPSTEDMLKHIYAGGTGSQ